MEEGSERGNGDGLFCLQGAGDTEIMGGSKSIYGCICMCIVYVVKSEEICDNEQLLKYACSVTYKLALWADHIGYVSQERPNARVI